MSPDKAHIALEVLTWTTGLAFLLVMLRGALAPMQASLQADQWLRWFWGLLATLILEAIGLILFATL